MRTRLSWLSEIMHPWVFLVSLILGLSLVMAVFVLLNFTRPAQQPVGMVTAALTVIPAPTETPQPLPTATPQPQDPNLPANPPSGTFSVGAFISINGTDGAGLRLRSGPGLDYDPLYLGVEGEIFRLTDGPRDADGYTWWLLVAPADETRQGWAVANYFSLAQNPE